MTTFSSEFEELNCKQCINAEKLGFDFTFAYQPIVRAQEEKVIGYEALARGMQKQPFASLFEKVTEANLYRFDQACRVKAIKLASQLNLRQSLSINFMPRAVYKPELCIRSTLLAAEEFGFPVNRITFEVVESERLVDTYHLTSILRAYKELGFRTAIDDFGAGYSGLNLLADFQPDHLKIDRVLISGIHQDKARQSIVRGILLICGELSVECLAEGVEQKDEYAWLREQGIDLFQGNYFAEPGFECLPEPMERSFQL